MNMQALLHRAFEPVEKSIRENQIPGAVLGLINSKGEHAICSSGSAQLIPDLRDMQDGTWFDLASLTKVIFTTPKILALCETGTISLDDPICSVLKDFRQYDLDCWERKTTFKQCLSHSTHFPAVEPIYTYGENPDLLRAFVLQRAWRKVPPCYSDINFILLGLALERISGKKIWEMDAGKGFAFKADPANCAATEDCTWRHRILCGEVHDDNCSALQGAGHAGLFGTASGILNFAEGILNRSSMSQTVLQQISTPVSSQRTLGWECAHEGWSGGTECSKNTIGHTGFTGTGLWIDFDKDLAWTLLTNRIHPSRHHDSGIGRLRQDVGNNILR